MYEVQTLPRIAISRTSSSDVVGQRNKMGGINFRATLVHSNTAICRLFTTHNIRFYFSFHSVWILRCAVILWSFIYLVTILCELRCDSKIANES